MEAPHSSQEVLGTFLRLTVWYRHGGTCRTHCSHYLANIEGAIDA